MKFFSIYILLFFSLCNASCGANQNASSYSDSALTELKVVTPKNNFEKEILNKIADISSGNSVEVGDTSCLVTSQYFAASGRECKTLEITHSKQTVAQYRTVCHFEEKWGYTPDVFPSSAGQ